MEKLRLKRCTGSRRGTDGPPRCHPPHRQALLSSWARKHAHCAASHVNVLLILVQPLQLCLQHSNCFLSRTIWHTDAATLQPYGHIPVCIVILHLHCKCHMRGVQTCAHSGCVRLGDARMWPGPTSGPASRVTLERKSQSPNMSDYVSYSHSSGCHEIFKAHACHAGLRLPS